MYAVIKTGGKQYRVEHDQKLLVERINADEGSVITLSDILMVVDSGKITKGNELQNVAVSATVVKQTRGPKIITLKHRRRKNSRRVKGHRQDLTLLKVVGIGDPKKLVIKDEKKVTKDKVQKDKVQKVKKTDETKVTKKETESKVTKASTAEKIEKVKAPGAKTSSKKEK